MFLKRGIKEMKLARPLGEEMKCFILYEFGNRESFKEWFLDRLWLERRSCFLP